jgi:hypothetical protein
MKWRWFQTDSWFQLPVRTPMILSISAPFPENESRMNLGGDRAKLLVAPQCKLGGALIGNNTLKSLLNAWDAANNANVLNGEFPWK